MTYQRRTLRRFSPTTRKVAKIINDAERTIKHLKAMLPVLQSIELDSQALWQQNKIRSKGEVDPGSLDFHQGSILSKVTKDRGGT